MTGKGRHHEGLAADPGNWLDGMSIRRSEMCRSIANGSYCEHFNSSRGCGFAHSIEEIAAVELAR
eukprot:12575650-Heterocapsa_arctica.AAC.1